MSECAHVCMWRLEIDISHLPQRLSDLFFELINFSYSYLCVVCVGMHFNCELAYMGIHMHEWMCLWRPEADAKSLTLPFIH